MTFAMSRSGAAVGIFALVAALAGCSDKLTRARFELIEVHVSDMDDVEDAIGDADEELDHRWLYERKKERISAIIDFEHGRVSRKQWISPGDWYDSRPTGEETVIYESQRVYPAQPGYSPAPPPPAEYRRVEQRTEIRRRPPAHRGAHMSRREREWDDRHDWDEDDWEDYYEDLADQQEEYYENLADQMDD